MPYGTGPIIRQAFIGATPWQRYLIGVAMVVVGVGTGGDWGISRAGCWPSPAQFCSGAWFAASSRRPPAPPEASPPGE